MTAVVSTYLFLAPEGFHLPKEIAYLIGGGITFLSVLLFGIYVKKLKPAVSLTV
jgi:hypothetical protein